MGHPDAAGAVQGGGSGAVAPEAEDDADADAGQEDSAALIRQGVETTFAEIQRLAAMLGDAPLDLPDDGFADADAFMRWANAAFARLQGVGADSVELASLKILLEQLEAGREDSEAGWQQLSNDGMLSAGFLVAAGVARHRRWGIEAGSVGGDFALLDAGALARFRERQSRKAQESIYKHWQR